MRREKAVIGARLRLAREEARVEKEEAAAAAGVQVAAITAWERGSSLPNLVQVRGLLSCYGLSSYKLLFGTAPVELTPEEAVELANAELSPRLKTKMSVVLALASRTEAVAAG